MLKKIQRPQLTWQASLPSALSTQPTGYRASREAISPIQQQQSSTLNTFLAKVMAKAAIPLSVEAAFSKTSDGLMIQPAHLGN